MQRADVVFFKASDNWISKTIAKITSSDYTHVGLVITDSSTNKCVIIEADRFIKTRKRVFTFDPSLHALYRIPNLTDTQKRDIVGYAESMVGTPYDYLQIIGFLLQLVFKVNTGNLFNRANSLICSELIDKALFTSNVTRKNKIGIGNVMPQDLLGVYPFILINPSLQKTL